MTIEERIRRREERMKNRKPALAVVCSSPKMQRFTLESPAVRFVCQSFGLPNSCGHPDIELLYEFDMQEYSTPLLRFLFDQIQEGARFSAGDRVTYHRGCHDYTVEFRPAESNPYGPMLRGVILELDMAYQELPSEEAINLIVDLLENGDPEEEAAFRIAASEMEFDEEMPFPDEDDLLADFYDL